MNQSNAEEAAKERGTGQEFIVNPQSCDTTNCATIIGPLESIKDDKVLALKIYTHDEHKGVAHPNSHMVYIKKGTPLYLYAKRSRRGDTISVIGPIARDRSIIPKSLVNHDADNRSAAPLLMDEFSSQNLPPHAALLIGIIREKSLGLLSHSITTAMVAKQIAIHLELPQDKVDDIYFAATLHDIGKIYIPDNILLSHRQLTEREFSIVKRHPEQGALIVEEYVAKAIKDAILFHHELADGSGYPAGINNSTIPIEAKIVAIADKYSAFTMDTPYRQAVSQEETLTHIEAHIDRFFNGSSDMVQKALKALHSANMQFESFRIINSTQRVHSQPGDAT